MSEIPESVRWSIEERTGITWYADASTTDRPTEDAFYLYAGRKGCDVWLRLRIQYVSDKPFNIARLQVWADDKVFEISEPRFKRDSDGKQTWQWLDDRVNADHLLMLFSVTAARNAYLRFIGPSHSDERIIGEYEKDALKAVLSTYRALGGQL